MKNLNRRLFLLSVLSATFLIFVKSYNFLYDEYYALNFQHLKKFLKNNNYNKSLNKKKFIASKSNSSQNKIKIMIKNDFSSGNVININGWIISETEINIALR
jgi:hypothetical protein